jgi:uncharacterized protein (TIGR04255 family)
VSDWKFKRANPIVNYTVGFELDPPIAPHLLKEISGLAPLFEADLPRKTEQQAFMFQMGPGVVPQTNIGGVTFDELERDGSMKRQLAVLPQTIFYSLAPYQRWVEYWPLADRILAEAAKVALRQSQIIAFVLNAVNAFYWQGPEDHIDYSGLIRDDCPYIAANVRRTKGLCHSFHGFVRPTDIPGRRIDNVNFMVGERADNVNVANLTFNIRVILNDRAQNYDLLFLDPTDSFVANCFKNLHESNNKLFAEVIVPEICGTIPGVPKL